MKNRLVFLCFSLLLTGCSSGESNSTGTTSPTDSSAIKDSTQSSYYEQYAEYYYCNMGPYIEMYAWKIDSHWYAGLMHLRNSCQSVEDVIRIQEINCPIEIMKEILDTYPEKIRKECALSIVSVPPLESELMHNDDINDPDFIYIRDYLGIFQPIK